MSENELEVVRARNTSDEVPETYTRKSMEHGTVAASRQAQADPSSVPEQGSDMAAETIPVDADPRVAMALLGAHEQERSRLAEELHDGPAQAFANAIFQTQLVERALREEPATAAAELASLRTLLERELDSLRGYINQLRPSLGEAVGLDEALRDSASAITQRSGLPIDLRLDADGTQLHAAARTVVLRVAQEAVRNIAKHAAASRAWIHTAEEGTPDGSRWWVLEVGDDGRGFDVTTVAANPNRRHFGLRFMRERAELLGSSLAIESHHAAGTIVRLTIALKERSHQ
ncbi:MAG TPA: sensor histidine kinase [Candidatus Limnocylindria bacterium]|nr:sensor histidine kinase [Candidatus Limnocylindria bacterium]